MSKPPVETLDPERIASLRELCDGEEDLIAELANLFLREVPVSVEALGTAAARRDFDSVVALAHRLKGACLNLGADGLGRLCSELEAAAMDRDEAMVDGLVVRVSARVPGVCEALKLEAARADR
jgi:HPt (histidine-containing phosphotransfer) domain-containing protein